MNPAPISTGKRGRVKKTKAGNLLSRLEEHQKAVLLFAHDFKVPFTNNEAERSFRFAKLKMKISGCFVSKKVGKLFFRIQSVSSTIKKQGGKVLEGLKKVFSGETDILDDLKVTTPP